jgi:VWFA-related protein
MNKFLQRIAACYLVATVMVATLPGQNTGSQQPFRIKVNSELVLVNVVVRDKDGQPVRNLTRDDFTVLEDNKPQTISSFDFENIDSAVALPAAGPSQSTILSNRKPAQAETAPSMSDEALRDHRLVVLFFDLTGMEPEEIDRAGKAAQKYVDTQMSPADLVAVVALSTNMQVVQDFTADRTLLGRALQRFSLSAGQGYAAGDTGDTEGTPDTAGAFTPDDTEYNVFNTDRKLLALQSLAESMSKIQQKKSIVYFSSGVQKTGIENQSEVRAAINAAVKANVSIYSVDIRGLQALPPGGEAQNASLRGTAVYSGQSQRNALNANFGSQETLVTLADDTGGRAFTDTNDFGKVFQRVQQDTATYYIIGYRSNNSLRDGRYRHIALKLKQQDYKLEYRSGYYAPRDFAHATRDDREEQLQAELGSDLPATDLGVYLATAYFRVDDAHYFVPVQIVVPGSEIPFTRDSDKDKATLDIMGYVRNDLKIIVGNARETVKLNLEGAQEVRRKNVQYSTGFTLPPGSYHLKFVVRENQTGRIGSFETDLTIPDLRKSPLRMSSILVGSQLNTAPRKGSNPLVHDGTELVPNITHVFAANQKLYFYYEVYEPARAKAVPVAADAKQATSPSTNKGKPGIRLLTNIAFFNGKVKAYETPLVEAHEINTPERHAAVFEFEVPLSQLKPGFYTCQINVVDDAAGTFSFPRLALLVRPEKPSDKAAPVVGQ